MGDEINLLIDYPQRDRTKEIQDRYERRNSENMLSACKFGWEYYDKKGCAYDGYIYDGRWIPVVKRFKDYYKLKSGDKVLDIGCAKGYMLYDFYNLGIDVTGVDISEYAINCVPPEIKDKCYVHYANDLPMFEDNKFDLVICINALHCMPEGDCRRGLREIQRVGKNAFISLDAWRNEEEEKRMRDWTLTAATLKSVDDWKQMFKDEGYTGDYYWFFP